MDLVGRRHNCKPRQTDDDIAIKRLAFPNHPAHDKPVIAKVEQIGPDDELFETVAKRIPVSPTSKGGKLPKLAATFDGKPKKEKASAKQPLQVWLDPELIKEVKIAAIEDEQRVESFVDMALREWLKARRA